MSNWDPENPGENASAPNLARKRAAKPMASGRS